MATMPPTRIDGSLLQFKTPKGIALCGFLREPPRRSRIAVIHIHGMGSFFWSNTALEVLRASVDAGVGAISINTHGSGDRNRLRGSRRTLAYGGTDHERFTDCVDDIDGAITAMRRLGYTRFILSGHSTGCQKVTHYQARKKNRAVRGLILLAPCDDVAIKRREIGAAYERCVKSAKRLIDAGKPHATMPAACRTTFDATRYHQLYSPRSIEGNIFNYQTSLTMHSAIRVPVLAVFGRNEPYAIKPVMEMLWMLASRFRHISSAAVLIEGDHGFRGAQDQLRNTVQHWIRRITS
ncbi:MAG: alpha/beta fold hydrolase [Nanoarchaeota archaeon]